MKNTIANASTSIPSTSNKSIDSDIIKTNAMILIAIDPIIAIMTIFGNGVFLITLFKTRNLHTPSNILLGALSISDLLVGVVAQTIWIGELACVVSEKQSSVFENLNYTAIWAFIFFSAIFITTVSLDRYAAVCYPIWYHAKVSCETHAILAAFLLIASIALYCLGQFVIHKADTYIPDYMFTVLMGSSLMITGFCNFRIFRVIKRQHREIRAVSTGLRNSSLPQRNSVNSHDRSKTMIIAIITFLFFICYAPVIITEAILDVLGIFKKSETAGSLCRYWAEFFVLLNSLINPIVYYARMKTFRKAAKDVFCSASRENVAI